MRRPHFAAAVIAALAASCPQPPADDPLVVIVLCDTLRRDALSCYGGENPTPGIDALAADGTRFEQAIASSGWTLPSVASILTGTWPSVHKAGGRAAKFTAITPDLPLGQEVLRDAGFHTLAFVNAAFLDGRLGLARGFERFDHAEVYNANIRRADVTVDAALLEIQRAAQDGPTFALLHLFDPHLNYDPPGTWAEGLDRADMPAPPLAHEHVQNLWPRDRLQSPKPQAIAYVRDVYEAEVRFLDAQIARLLAGLRAAELYERALIVLVADHGEEFWDHDTFEHGHTLYDELVRVPLIVKWPGGTGPTLPAVEAQVRTLDLMPTVFAALDLTAPESFVGESLLPLATGADERSRIAFSERNLYGDERIAWRTDPYKYILARGPAGHEHEELYDWRADPGETRNLAGAPEHAATLERLRREAAAFRYAAEEKGARLADGKLYDLSPSANKDYVEWVKRMRGLGYVGEESR